MILTTTNSIEGFRIIDYKGIVTGTSYNSSYKFKDIEMSFKDMFSAKKYNEAYEKGVQNIKEEAFQKLKENAKALNANAVVGIQVDIELVSNSYTLLVSITGTAVSVVSNK